MTSLLFHKPYGVLSQFTPEPGSRWQTLADLVDVPEVYAAGRLDADIPAGGNSNVELRSDMPNRRELRQVGTHVAPVIDDDDRDAGTRPQP